MSDKIGGEEVEVVGYASTVVPEDTPLMAVTQHQRIVGGLNEVIDRKNRRISDLANEVVALACENDKLREEVSAARIAGLRMALEIWDQGMPGAYYAKALEEAIEREKQE
jgi:hypothetical protein